MWFFGGGQTTSPLTPPQITANTDDYEPTDGEISLWWRLETDASRDLTGIIEPDLERILLLTNIGAFDLVLKHDATSTAEYRFLCPGSVDFTLTPNSSVLVFYDYDSERWRVMG